MNNNSKSLTFEDPLGGVGYTVIHGDGGFWCDLSDPFACQQLVRALAVHGTAVVDEVHNMIYFPADAARDDWLAALHRAERSLVRAAEQWLVATLGPRTLSSETVRRLAAEARIAPQTLRRARENVCEVVHPGGKGRTAWRIRPPTDQ